eukprot:3982903-Pyramimonas_sp.AAC.1
MRWPVRRRPWPSGAPWLRSHRWSARRATMGGRWGAPLKMHRGGRSPRPPWQPVRGSRSGFCP